MAPSEEDEELVKDKEVVKEEDAMHVCMEGPHKIFMIKN
jgi:hypothetical protein